MNKIIKILMRRDGMTLDEAKALVADVIDMMNDAIANGDYDEAEMIVEDELGLEPDYIPALLGCF